MTPILHITDILHRAAPKAFWISILISQCVVFLFLQKNGRRFPREWRRDEERRIRYQAYSVPTSADSKRTVNQSRLRKPESTYDVFGTSKWFKDDPIEWLTLRDLRMHEQPWLLALPALFCAGFSALTAPQGLYVAVIFSIAIVFYLCLASSRPIAYARRSNVYELLLMTPLNAMGIVQGHLRALRWIFFWPCLILLMFWGSFFAWELWQMRAHPGGLDIVAFVAAGYLMAGVILLVCGIPWIGMWMGLVCKTPGRAVFATITLALLIPRLGFGWFIDAPYFVILGSIARYKVLKNFHKLVSERFS